MSPKQKGGHPAGKDPLVAKLTRTTTAAVELVRDLQPRLDPDTYLILQSGSLGLLWVMSEVTNMPSPVDVTGADYQTMQQIKAEAWNQGYTTGNAHNGRRDANPYLDKE